MSAYRRMRVPGGTYFFTVNLQDRHASLLIEHIDVLSGPRVNAIHFT
jgi:putative transposase